VLGLKASSSKSWMSKLNLFRSQRIMFRRCLPSFHAPLLPLSVSRHKTPSPTEQKKCCTSALRDHFRFFSRRSLILFSLRHRTSYDTTTPRPTPTHLPLSSPDPHFPRLCPKIPNSSSFVAGRNLSLDTSRVKGAGLYLVRDTGHDRD
jgi:hypothetical protein